MTSGEAASGAHPVSRETAREARDLAGLPVCEFADPGPLRDRLVRAVLDRSKTATSSLFAEYSAEDPLPVAGQRFAVVDSAGARVAAIEVTSVEVLPMAEITSAFAVEEGEGFASVTDWREAHEQFWRDDPYVRELGIELNDETLVVAERFRLVR